jgi:hypothetical protein
VWLFGVHWPVDTTLFSAGQMWSNALPDHNQLTALHEEGTGQGNGERAGQCYIKSKATGCNKGGHLCSMECACCTTLGVSDTLVQQLQRVSSAGRRGAWGHKHEGHLFSCI